MRKPVYLRRIKDWESNGFEGMKIYPDSLQANETTIDKTSVQFLGMKISEKGGGDGRIHISVWDKREDFAFKVRNYPSSKSYIPRNVGRAVFIGQLHRYHRICTEMSDFLHRSSRLARILIYEKLYSKASMFRAFHCFVRNHVSRYPKCSHSHVLRLFTCMTVHRPSLWLLICLFVC